MEFPIFTTIRCQREDLKHPRNNYSPPHCEWFVESGFIAAASMTRPDNIVLP
jgi:hypothetical protein